MCSLSFFCDKYFIMYISQIIIPSLWIHIGLYVNNTPIKLGLKKIKTSCYEVTITQLGKSGNLSVVLNDRWWSTEVGTIKELAVQLQEAQIADSLQLTEHSGMASTFETRPCPSFLGISSQWLSRLGVLGLAISVQCGVPLIGSLPFRDGSWVGWGCVCTVVWRLSLHNSASFLFIFTLQ